MHLETTGGGTRVWAGQAEGQGGSRGSSCRFSQRGGTPRGHFLGIKECVCVHVRVYTWNGLRGRERASPHPQIAEPLGLVPGQSAVKFGPKL